MIKVFYECIAGDNLCRYTKIVTVQNGPERGEHAHQELKKKGIRLAAPLPQERTRNWDKLREKKKRIYLYIGYLVSLGCQDHLDQMSPIKIKRDDESRQRLVVFPRAKTCPCSMA